MPSPPPAVARGSWAADPQADPQPEWDERTTETTPVPRPVFERWMAAIRFAIYAGAAIIAAAVLVAGWLR